MLVVAREKSEHKKEVMMMVAIKKEETQGGGGLGFEKLTKLGCCGVVVTIHPRTTIMTSPQLVHWCVLVHVGPIHQF